MRLKVSIILIISMILTTVAFAVDNSGANIPDLYDGLYPIKYSETGDVIFTSKNDSTWYNYSEGRWANAVTLDREGQMNPSLATVDNITGYYVWIPRYAYLIRTGYNTSDTGRIDIRFIEGTTNKDKTGKTYFTVDDLDNVSEKWEEVNTVTYVGDRQMDYLIHPAFKFEEELSGIWVGKSEANQGIEREIELVKTMPNEALWTSIDINRAFEATRDMISKSENYDKYNLYGLGEEVNTHLIKPVEYGAIIYLESSMYASKQYYGVNNIDTVKEYVAGGLEGTTNIYMDKYLDIYTKDGEYVNDIKGSAYLETSDGVNGWYGQAITNITDEKTVIVKENEYGSIASNGVETDTGFRVVITRGTNKNKIKTIYQKDDSYWWLMQNGDLWAMGNNDDDQLGIGNIGYKPIPIKIEKDKEGNKIPAIERIVCIENNIYYIAKDGTKYLKGELNIDEIDLEQDTITILPNLQKEQLEIYNTLGEIKAIYGNQTSAIIKTVDGDIYVIGDNTNNKLGISGIANITTPMKINLTGIKDVGIGSDFGVFLKEDGSIVGYGNATKNGNGLTGISQIAVGENTAYFMKNDGTVISNQGSIIANNAYKIAAGANHLVILKKDGTVQTIGQTNSNLTNVIDIFAGKDMTVYLTEDNKTYIMQNNTLTELALQKIVYAELNGTQPYFLTYDRQLLYQDGTAVTVAGSELHRIREIKGDIALTEKNGLYNFGDMEYIRFEEGTYHKINSVGNQLEDYRIYGNSIQNGTPSPDNPVEIESVGYKSKNFFDISKVSTVTNLINNGDGTLTCDKYATNSGKTLKELCPTLKVGDIVTLSAETTGFRMVNGVREPVNFIYIYNPSTDSFTWYFGSSLTITQEILDSSVFFYAGMIDGISETTIISNIQIEYGDKATEYIPYGKYKIPVKATGKNLFDSFALEDKGYISNIDENNGEFKFINVSSIPAIYINAKENTVYTISYEVKVVRQQTVQLTIYYTDGTYKSISKAGVVGQYVSVTGTSDSSKTIDYVRFGASGGLARETCFKKIQIEEGDTATEYEPYKKIKTNIYLDEPLRAIDEYADYIDFKNQKLVRRIGRKTINFNFYNYQDEYNYLYLRGVTSGMIPNTLDCLSDKIAVFKPFPGSSDYNALMVSGNAFYYLVSAEKSEQQAYINLLANTEIYYPLVTPVEESIEVPMVDIFEGYNEISIDTEVQPSNMMIKYNYEGSILD